MCVCGDIAVTGRSMGRERVKDPREHRFFFVVFSEFFFSFFGRVENRCDFEWSETGIARRSH